LEEIFSLRWCYEMFDDVFWCGWVRTRIFMVEKATNATTTSSRFSNFNFSDFEKRFIHFEILAFLQDRGSVAVNTHRH
jgi:hypothetical protein